MNRDKWGNAEALDRRARRRVEHLARKRLGWGDWPVWIAAVAAVAYVAAAILRGAA